MLRVVDVHKSFRRGAPWRRRRVHVLRGASLIVGPGEFVGLVGENGSGKSTLMHVIVLGRDAGSVERPARLGFCPQQPLLWDKLTVSEHFELFAEAYELGAEHAARLRDVLLGELQFAKYVDYRVEELSGGTRQKLNLALAMPTSPSFCSSTSPTADLTGRRISGSGRWRSVVARTGWRSSSSATFCQNLDP